MYTKYGVRVRTVDSVQFTTTGDRSYQIGTIFPQRNTMLAIGAHIHYNRPDVAAELQRTTNNYIEKKGFKETAIVTQNGDIEDYLENGRDVAPKVQTWFVLGYLGHSALTLDAYRSHRSIHSDTLMGNATSSQGVSS
jgi:hypothetical protein